MFKMPKFFIFIALMIVSCSALANSSIHIPILCYHNFNPTTPGSMNMKPDTFESQMNWLEENGFNIIPLQDAVAYLQGKKDKLPPKAIVVTIDDGWKSVYTYLTPIIKKHRIPVTLFIYPQTISSGKNAMTWDELKELQQTRLFDIQSHTYSHPNFKQEKKHRSADSFHAFVENELVKSKKILDEKLNTHVTLLAWPFGIYNEALEKAAQEAGYDMAFTIDAIPATRSNRAMAEPRYMILESQTFKTFQKIANGATGC